MSASEHLKTHIGLGLPTVNAVIDMRPTSVNTVTSPIAGDPDLTKEESIGGIQHIATGFLLPNRGYIDQIGCILQNNVGTADLVPVRWSVVKLKKDVNASTGISHAATLDTGLVNVALNANGQQVLKSYSAGSRLAVPSQFVIAVKAGMGVAVKVQAMLSAGPIPGVVGTVSSGNLVSAATYTFGSTDFGATPGEIPPGDPLAPTSYKALAIYIKWTGTP